MNAIPTPADLSITPRDRRFSRGVAVLKLDADRVRAALLLALSITFPRGEALFVDSVKRFRDGAAPWLAADIAAFVKQEVAHSREHLAFNRRVTASGYDVTRLEAAVTRRLDELKSQPAIVSLAATIALEHYTAVFAHILLRNPVVLEGLDEETAQMWRWHAIEEIEHKGVAYDTWLHATRDWSALRRYLTRVSVMLRITRHFIGDRAVGIVDLLRQDGFGKGQAWRGMLWQTLGNPGLLRKTLRPWLGYFKPGFHPWDEDDHALIAETYATFGPFEEQDEARAA